MSRRATIATIAAVAAALGVAGWRLFWFQTDDAYIAFRYVSNSLAGRGLVWNPAPFLPVEGYTSLLWVLLLREVWRFTGVAPPDSANVLSLLFGLATLLLGFRLLLRMALPERVERYRLPLAALALLGTVSNRTFLAWLSSGLETALFNFLFTWWFVEGIFAGNRGRWWTFRLCAAAGLCALCRPDGMLIAAATVAMIGLTWKRDRRIALATAPLLVVPLHLWWRFRTYGDWLPNTYRAKYSGAWPESGIRYLGSFAVEYGLWLPMLLALAWILRARRWPALSVRTIPPLTLGLHAAYYTFIIGGDHFEYRVYSHLILLLFVAAAWLSAQVARSGKAVALLATCVLVSWPIPWVHWAATKDLSTRAETAVLIRPIADRFPWPLRAAVAQWDGWQAWLIHHSVGMRHQEHKVFELQQARLFPPRAGGSAISWQEHPVISGGTVGVPGWVLPNVAIIDRHGLNDRVIARTAPAGRQMAHEHFPPPGYVECFRPNVVIQNRTARVLPREQPLTDEEIRRCESADWGSFPAH